jgi:hypothetical protein
MKASIFCLIRLSNPGHFPPVEMAIEISQLRATARSNETAQHRTVDNVEEDFLQTGFAGHQAIDFTHPGPA